MDWYGANSSGRPTVQVKFRLLRSAQYAWRGSFLRREPVNNAGPWAPNHRHCTLFWPSFRALMRRLLPMQLRAACTCGSPTNKRTITFLPTSDCTPSSLYTPEPSVNATYNGRIKEDQSLRGGESFVSLVPPRRGTELFPHTHSEALPLSDYFGTLFGLSNSRAGNIDP